MDYIKLMRSLKEKSYYSKDSEKLHLWIHLLLSANWSEKEELLGGKPILCQAGEFTTGRKQLSRDTGIDEYKIERALTYFEKIEQQIAQRKTSTNRLISILNWDKYQIIAQQNAQQLHNDCTTTAQRLHTPKEYKEEKKEIIKKNNIDAAKAATKIRIEEFKISLFKYTKLKGGIYEDNLVKEFYEYWSELNKSETKMRWELQKTFEVSKRLATWIKNNDKFKHTYKSKSNITKLTGKEEYEKF